MPLFSIAAGLAANALSKKVTGKSIGGHVKGLIGANQTAPSFNPDTQQLEDDISRVRGLSTKDIKGNRLSATTAVDELNRGTDEALGQISGAASGRFMAMQDAISEQGGLDSGASERLARDSNRNANLGQQELLGGANTAEAGIRAQDFAGQEQQKFESTLRLPQLSALPLEIQNAAAAANMRAKALTDANNKGKMGGLGSLVGAGAGFALGGPMGAAVGAGAGKSIFSMFG